VSQPNSPNPFELLIEQIRSVVREVIREEIGGGRNGDSPLLSAEAAAKLWDVPKTWILESARRGEIASVKVGHYVRFRPDDLKAFVEKRRQKTS
jgi:excisionase family DNA binding protein